MGWSAEEAHQIIHRCTRDGRVLWQHVALQMGMSLDSVRSQFDPTHRRTAPQAAAPRPAPIRRPAHTVTYGPLGDKIIDALRHGPLAGADVVERTGGLQNSVYTRLGQLAKAGRVNHNDSYPRIWRLVEDRITEEAA
jgi:hypothetical protein